MSNVNPVESQFEKSLREMYELGVKHGRTLAESDLKIEQLKKEAEALAQPPSITPKGRVELIQAFEGIIGQDETSDKPIQDYVWDDIFARNGLRAEQRAALIGLEDGKIQGAE